MMNAKMVRVLKKIVALLLYGALVFHGAYRANAAEDRPATPHATPEGIEFFEKHIRPVLVERCYSCHSPKAKIPMGKLRLDSRAGMLAGGQNGLVLVPGEPEKSRLIRAIRYTDKDLQMP